MIRKRMSVRLRVTLLVLVPLVFLAGLAAYDIARSASSALTLIRSKTMLTDLGPPVASLQQALTAERTQTIIYSARPAPGTLAALRHSEAVTDRAVALVVKATNSSAVRSDASGGGRTAIEGLRKDLARLAPLRAGLADFSVTDRQAFTAYSGMIAASYQVLEQAIIQDGNSTQVLPKIAIVELAISNEYVQQESALLNGDFADRTFPAAAYQAFVTLVGAHRLLYGQSYAYLDQADRSGLNRDVGPQAQRRFTALENTLVADGPRRGAPPVSAAVWNGDVGTLSARVQHAVGQALARLVAGARAQASATLRGLYLTGCIGLAAVIVSLLLSIWIAVSLARQLRGLRDMALDLADVRLPALVRQLGSGEEVDTASQLPEVQASTDEIGQVQAAFINAQRMAVEATIDQARMRRGVADLFRNLARRSHSLLARQMMLIDTLERRATGPDDLESLFRIDHLTTRMRRHAESLIVLAGDLPERTFLDPVPFVDVLRAAAAEVEDYTRIKVVCRSSAALAGPAVADVVHMLAEFLENATRFSPPTAEVRVTGNLASRGYSIDIEDRGLGMTEHELTEANARLAAPPMFDLTGSDRLGLHVAAQLARRHAIRITLRDSPYGGTTAIVLIPTELVIQFGAQPGDVVLADPGRPPGEVRGNRRVPALSRVSGNGEANGSGASDLFDQGQVWADPLATPGRHAFTNPTVTEVSPAGNGMAGNGMAGNGMAGNGMAGNAPAARGVAGNGSAMPADPMTVTPDEAERDGSPAAWTENGLPMRVRQQNLAQPLRDNPAPAEPAGPATNSVSPDAARGVMSAFWQGRTRGLSEADHDNASDADGPADGEAR